MAARFVVGETKVRPGIYYRQENASGVDLIGATNGVVAVAFKANSGPLGEIMTIQDPSDAYRYFGDDTGAGSNVAILSKIFMGGASVIKALRVGSGGTKATTILKDDATTGVNVVTLTARYAGSRSLKVTIRASLSVPTEKECLIYDGDTATILGKVNFTAGEAEVDGIIAAINAAGNFPVTASKIADGSGSLADVSNAAFSTAGTSPTITNADYSAAFEKLAATNWNTICCDSDDNSVQALLSAAVTVAGDEGQLGIAVIGEPTSVSFDTRVARAKAYDSENVVYCLNGFKINGEAYEGFNAAAVMAGYIAYLPCNDSVTHKTIAGATEIIGSLTTAEIIECLQNGCLVFTYSSKGTVWIEQGLTTLTTLGINKDAGWKKIRRTKTRYELITRININSEGIIGNVNNDANGRATFITIANGVIRDMIAEGKLLSGNCAVDRSNAPKGDSAWFIIDVIDLDSIEKVYFVYRFHFSEE